jgi:hypothetical protein
MTVLPEPDSTIVERYMEEFLSQYTLSSETTSPTAISPMATDTTSQFHVQNGLDDGQALALLEQLAKDRLSYHQMLTSPINPEIFAAMDPDDDDVRQFRPNNRFRKVPMS